VPASGTVFALGSTNVTCTATDTSGNTANCAFTVTVTQAAPEVHDLAIIRLKVPRNINLNTNTHVSVTKRVVVQIQNRSAHDETITGATLSNNLVSVTLSNLHTSCTPPTADLISGPPNNVPKTLKSKGKLNLFFNVTYSTNCVPDAMKGVGHEDFSYRAHVNHAAIDGNADTHTADDDCPRAPLPGGVDNAAGLNIKDKGCGHKDPVTGQLGAPLLTDVVLKP